MTRSALACFVIAALGLAALAALAARGLLVMPSYRAAWLMILALPLGALPLVMGADCIGPRASTPVTAALRNCLGLMPFGALLAIPVLLHLSAPDPLAAPARGLVATWTAPAAVAARSVLVLMVWTLMALRFRRPPGAPRTALVTHVLHAEEAAQQPSRSTHKRRGPFDTPSSAAAPDERHQGFAVLGLALHVVMGTVAAGDWVGALDPGLHSSSLGLLVITAQCGFAYGVACLMAARSGTLATRTATLLAVLAALWMFLQFTQYLVVWSANLPDEIRWYLARGGVFGRVAEAAALLGVVLAVAAWLFRWDGQVLLGVAAVLVLVHALEWFWFVVPSSRGTLRPTLVDAAALVTAAAVVGGAMTSLIPTRTGRAHGRG